jgi:hypothetical protein
MSIRFNFFTEGSPLRVVEQFNRMGVDLEVGRDGPDGENAYYVRTVTPAFITSRIENGVKLPGVEGRGFCPDMALYRLHEKFKVTANGCEWFAAQNSDGDYDLYRYNPEKWGPEKLEIRIAAPKVLQLA